MVRREDGGEKGWWWLWVGGHCWWWEVVGVWIEVDGSFIDKDDRDEGAQGLSPKANNFTGLVTYIVYGGLRWCFCTIFYICPPLTFSLAPAQAWDIPAASPPQTIERSRFEYIFTTSFDAFTILRLCPMLPTHFLPRVPLQESRIIVTQVSTLIAQLFSL